MAVETESIKPSLRYRILGQPSNLGDIALVVKKEGVPEVNIDLQRVNVPDFDVGFEHGFQAQVRAGEHNLKLGRSWNLADEQFDKMLEKAPPPQKELMPIWGRVVSSVIESKSVINNAVSAGLFLQEHGINTTISGIPITEISRDIESASKLLSFQKAPFKEQPLNTKFIMISSVVGFGLLTVGSIGLTGWLEYQAITNGYWPVAALMNLVLAGAGAIVVYSLKHPELMRD